MPAARPAVPGDVVINEVVTDPQTDWSSNGFSGVPGGGGLARPSLHVGDRWQVTGVVVENTTASSALPAYRLQPRFDADLAQIVDGQARPNSSGDAAAATDTPEPTATAEP